jgi:PIN domain nuclease of toxin-antitoxin system
VLAYLQAEPGADLVAEMLAGAVISTVNAAEVLQKCVARSIATDGLYADLAALGLQTVDFSLEHAERSAKLWPLTRAQGLSLADRACLALAQGLKLPVYTADRDWKPLEKVLGLDIRVIR